MIIRNPHHTKILLIQQYGSPHNILVAGYVDKTECLEEAVVREVKEEIGLQARDITYHKSEYFPKANTLICNFICTVESEDLSKVSDWEVDKAQWFHEGEILRAVKPNSLAKRFLEAYLDTKKNTNLSVL